LNKSGNIYWIVGLLILFLAVDVALATSLLTPPLSRQYIVQPGETLADVARQSRSHQQPIVTANDLHPGAVLQPGQVLRIPRPPLSALLHWPVQLAGTAGTLAGVILSLWLCRQAGLVPRAHQGRALTVTCLVGIIIYAAGQYAGPQLVTTVTPHWVWDCVAAGFACGASILLLAATIGFRGDKAT
jgi:hypothetical protein